MFLTVGKALDILHIDEHRVLAGRKGLDRVITRVNILEVPDIIQWLDGGELLLTTGFALKDNPELQLSLLGQLAHKGVAALAIKEGRYLTPIPLAMLEYAEHLSFPLIELPADLPLSRVMAPIYEILLNQQLSQKKHAERIHSLFLDIILKNQGMTEIGNTLVNLVNKHVAIVDTSFDFLYQSNLHDIVVPWSDLLNASKSRLVRTYNRKVTQVYKPIKLRYEEWELLIHPIVNNNISLGYIFLVANEPINLTQDRMACEQAALVTALELIKLDAIYNAECKNKEEIIEELLYGSITNPSVIKRKASSLNFLLEGKLLIFIIEWDDTSIAELNPLKKVEQIFTYYEGGVLCCLRANQIIGLIHAPDNSELKLVQLLNEIADDIRHKSNKKAKIGLGRGYERLEDIVKSYEEARVAVQLAARIGAKDKVVFFEKLGSLVCLNEIKKLPVGKNFYQQTIGKLKEYDKHNDTQLLFTLEAYFNNFCVFSKTAQALYIHRNSLAYRLKKIIDITGKDFLNNPADRFDLELALKLGYILD